ncbi:MAG TPA: hypothetical protein VF348_06055 [Usitatibacter sp.]
MAAINITATMVVPANARSELLAATRRASFKRIVPAPGRLTVAIVGLRMTECPRDEPAAASRSKIIARQEAMICALEH